MKSLVIEISPRNDLWRKRHGITQKLTAAKLAQRNAFRPKSQRARRKVWGLYRVETKGAKLLESIAAPTMAAAAKVFRENVVAVIRRKPSRKEGVLFCAAM